MIKNQKGFSQLVLIVVVAAVAAAGYGVYRWMLPAVPDNKMMDESEEMMEAAGEGMTDDSDGSMLKEDKMMEGDGSLMENKTMDSGMMMEYSGKVLAGSSSPLLDYNKSDFEAVLKTDKLVVIYFYANWCPICKAEFPKMQDAFNELKTDMVVGFRVNYNDDETDNDEKDLARQYGVAYQHTKVFVRNGERIGKWPDSWDKARYLSEIVGRL